MKTKPNECVDAFHGLDAHKYESSAGLTKREHFASIAMQGFCQMSIILTELAAKIHANPWGGETRIRICSAG